jgi:hypothetical protein
VIPNLLRYHVFRLINELALLNQDVLFKFFRNFGVAVGRLSDYEVQENDIGDKKDREENKPEDAVVELFEVKTCPYH